MNCVKTLVSALACLVFPMSASAMDTTAVMATELGRPDRGLVPIGFLQPQVDAMLGGPVHGLEAEGLRAHNGETAAFNTVQGGGSTLLRVFRARLGARGSIPGTDQKVSYTALFEAGDNALTRADPVVPTDLSVTLSYIPGARVRVGQFKLPVMEEIAAPVASHLEFVHFSTTMMRLLMENPIQDGAYTGGASAFRDVGMQVFDGMQSGQLGAAWAVMVSNGSGIMAGEPDNAKDVSGRLEVAWVTDGERHDPNREEVKLGAWHLQGTRPWEDGREDRVRQGLFVHVEQSVAWGMAEVARGRGMLEAGLAPPFQGGGPVVVPDGEGWGAVIQGGGRIRLGDRAGRLGLKARYDRYMQQTENTEALRVFQTTTFGVELDPVQKLRLQANYELRRLDAPNGSADAKAIAESMGDRVTVQATARF